MWRSASKFTTEIVTAILLLFVLGLLTSITASVIICTNSRSALIVFAIFSLGFAILLLIWCLIRPPHAKERAVSAATAFFCVLSAFAQFSETDRYRPIAPQVNLAVLYCFTAVSVTSLLSLLYRFATSYFFQRALRLRGVQPYDETLLYFSVNLLCAFLSAVVVSASSADNRRASFDSTALAYSIAVWFVNGALFGAVGWCLARPRPDLASVYDSTPALVADAPGYADIASHPD